MSRRKTYHIGKKNTASEKQYDIRLRDGHFSSPLIFCIVAVPVSGILPALSGV